MSSEEITLTLIRGDCLKVLLTFPENIVDLVVADPPYYVLEDVNQLIEHLKNCWELVEEVGRSQAIIKEGKDLGLLKITFLSNEKLLKKG
jgi:DNA modification methylase